MIIVENGLSLVDERKYEDPVGIATYSNSESTVLPYAYIFENLWIQLDFKCTRQNRQREQKWYAKILILHRKSLMPFSAACS